MINKQLDSTRSYWTNWRVWFKDGMATCRDVAPGETLRDILAEQPPQPPCLTQDIVLLEQCNDPPIAAPELSARGGVINDTKQR